MNTGPFIQVASTFTAAPLAASLQSSLRDAGIAEELAFVQFTQMSEYMLAFSQYSSEIRVTVVLLRLEDWLREYLKSSPEQASLNTRLREELRLRVEEFVSQFTILAHLGKPVCFLACPSTGWLASEHNLTALCRTFTNLVTARIRSIPEAVLLTWPSSLPPGGFEDRDADCAAQIPFTAEAFQQLGDFLGSQLAGILAANDPGAAVATSGSPELAAYLAGLNLRVQLAPAGPTDRTDVERLLRSVVAFSLTGEKPTVSPAEVDAVLAAEGCVLVSVADRVSDYGPSGLIVYRSEAQDLIIQSLSLSCTVLGKQVEYALLSALGQTAVRLQCPRIVFEYHETGRNQAVLAFLKQAADRESDTRYVLSASAIEGRISQIAVNPGAWALTGSL